MTPKELAVNVVNGSASLGGGAEPRYQRMDTAGLRQEALGVGSSWNCDYRQVEDKMTNQVRITGSCCKLSRLQPCSD